MSQTKRKKPAAKKATKTKAKSKPASRAATRAPRNSTAKNALNRAVEHSKGKSQDRMVLANTRVMPDIKSRAEQICEARGTNLTSFMRESINQLVETYAA